MSKRYTDLIKNDSYVLRFKDGRFYTVSGSHWVRPETLADLNAALEKRRVATYIEKYGHDKE